MKRNIKAVFLLVILFSFVFTSFSFAEEKLVVLPGTIQSALGGTDWDPAGDVTKMTNIGNDIYQFKGIFPAGKYEYKVAVGGSWAENYGMNGEQDGKNIKLEIPEDNTEVTFTFDYNTKKITDSINGEAVVEETAPKVAVLGGLEIRLPGTIQSVLGGTDWDPAGDVTKMTHIGDDVYEFKAILPKGNYEYKVTVGGSWDENYGKDGAADGSNIELTVPADNTEVTFTFDYKTKSISHNLEIVGVNFIPVLTNTFEKKGKDADINVTNEFEFGILSKNLTVNSKTSLNFDLDHKKYTIVDSSIEKENLSLKDVEIEDFSADYKIGNLTVGGMINKSSYEKSTDFLGVIDPNTGSDDRDNTKNPEDIANNNIAGKVSYNNGIKLNAAVSSYKADIFEESKTKKTFGYLNLEKTFANDKIKVGTSNGLYSVKYDGKKENTAIDSTVYGEIKVNDKFSLKTEVGYVPTGTIETAITGTHKNGTNWDFIFDPADYDITDDISEVHLVGAFNGWDPADKTYTLTEQSDGTWTGTFADSVVGGKEYKFIYDATSWNGNEKGLPESSGSNAKVEETNRLDPKLDYGLNLYFAEANYNLFDKGNLKVGTKFLKANTYMPFASDDLLDDSSTGYVDNYLNADYKVLKNLKLYVEKTHKTQEVNRDKLLSTRLKAGFELTETPVVSYVKGYYLADPQDSNFNAELKEIFIETKTEKLPLVKYITVNTTQRFESKTSQYYVESELKEFSKMIEYVKGNLTYAVDDVYYSDQDGKAVQYWTEAKAHNLPIVSYVKAGYESDDNGGDGIVERSDYKDQDDNDWLKKFYAETKLEAKSLKNWDGLTVNYETRKLEEGKTDYTPSDLNQDEQYYVASEKSFIDWYSILTFTTGYKLPFDIQTNFTYKYDLAHKNTSEFEDDAMKVELEKKIGITTINASYNKQDGDEGEDYTKVSFKSVF
ncbi:hypothetical protein EV215_1590 [Hypnocyclicus thermotrophus]|uniref:Amylopullulanase X25 domain-containing protein n=1 Tax=Hypnocyclicus thermotrophus TaxID=1627895 RepID=A0AA46DXK5_9FUSO|nr:hypothetical protein [Hypnocyclicus thermotrophus]TDT68523.1 hypothetical protein EV215_1590 [Hypnocyclicus thermotrophus]